MLVKGHFSATRTRFVILLPVLVLILLNFSVVRIQSEILFRQHFGNAAGKALKDCWETWRIHVGKPCDKEALKQSELDVLRKNNTDEEPPPADLVNVGIYPLQISIEKSCATGAECVGGICKCKKEKCRRKNVPPPICPLPTKPKAIHCHAEMEAFLSP